MKVDNPHRFFADSETWLEAVDDDGWKVDSAKVLRCFGRVFRHFLGALVASLLESRSAISLGFVFDLMSKQLLN